MLSLADCVPPEVVCCAPFAHPARAMCPACRRRMSRCRPLLPTTLMAWSWAQRALSLMPPSCQSEDSLPACLPACLPATSHGWSALLPSLHIWPSAASGGSPQMPCTLLTAVASCRRKDGAAVRLIGGCSATLADGMFWDVSVRGALAALQGRRSHTCSAWLAAQRTGLQCC